MSGLIGYSGVLYDILREIVTEPGCIIRETKEAAARDAFALHEGDPDNEGLPTVMARYADGVSEPLYELSYDDIAAIAQVAP